MGGAEDLEQLLRVGCVDVVPKIVGRFVDEVDTVRLDLSVNIQLHHMKVSNRLR